jgi:hypothetical protein
VKNLSEKQEVATLLRRGLIELVFLCEPAAVDFPYMQSITALGGSNREGKGREDKFVTDISQKLLFEKVFLNR